jgi:predicted transcriptional regulator YdeE
MDAPQIVTKSAFPIVGLHCSFIHALSPDANDQLPLSDHWEKLVERSTEVTDRIDLNFYGYVYRLPPAQRSHPDELHYLAGVRADPAPENVTDRMVKTIVPASKYAVFTYQGVFDAQFAQFVQSIYQEWLPQSGYEHGQSGDVEMYDNRFKPEHSASEMEYWLPIRPA